MKTTRQGGWCETWNTVTNIPKSWHIIVAMATWSSINIWVWSEKMLRSEKLCCGRDVLVELHQTTIYSGLVLLVMHVAAKSSQCCYKYLGPGNYYHCIIHQTLPCAPLQCQPKWDESLHSNIINIPATAFSYTNLQFSECMICLVVADKLDW